MCAFTAVIGIYPISLFAFSSLCRWIFFRTSATVSYLTDKMSKCFDSGLFTGVILIDLQKAFDTIDHNILLLKMPSLVLSCEVIDWYKSYLSSRKFHVNVHDKFSTFADLRCRVPQRSIFGPLLNDMPQAVDYDLFHYGTQMIHVFYFYIKIWSE